MNLKRLLNIFEMKKILKSRKLSCAAVSGLMILILSFSFLTSVKDFSDNLMMMEAHNLFLTAHLNYHERDDHRDDSSHKESDNNHSHTHKHGDGEEEHTHNHLVTVNISDILLFNTHELKIHSYEIGKDINFHAHILVPQSFILETFRPPIHS